MFDLPDAKRVRRTELYTRSQSESTTASEPDPELEAEIRARLASIYGPSAQSIQAPGNESTNINGDEQASEEQGELEFEFRLFSTQSRGKSVEQGTRVAQKIVLEFEGNDSGDGGFVVRERSKANFIAEKAHGARLLGFETMALSGEEVLSCAKKRAWGLEVPWRVQTFKISGKTEARKAVQADVIVSERHCKHKRPGKKQRIILRGRLKLKKEVQERQKAEIDKREEAGKEKRIRRNREKKLKRKMKEKAEKAQKVGNDAGDDTNDSMKLGRSSIAFTDEAIPD